MARKKSIKKLPKKSVILRKKYNHIKNFVTFKIKGKKLTGGLAKKIDYYYESIIGLTDSRMEGVHIYRPRKKENLKPAQIAAHHGLYLPDLKCAFFRKNPDSKIKIIVKNGKVEAHQDHTRLTYANFDYKKLELNPEKYMDNVLKNLDGERFLIAAGKHTIKIPASRYDLKERVLKLYNEYKNIQFHEPEEWLTGVETLHTHKQKSPVAYIKSREKARTNKAALKDKKKKEENEIKKLNRKAKKEAAEKADRKRLGDLIAKEGKKWE